MHVRLVVNPRAGSGSAARQLPEIQRQLRRVGVSFDVAQTSAPGEGALLAAAARRDDVECVAVVGGDGTLNEVCQAYVDASGNVVPGPDLALIPCGTGGDFRKSFGLENDIELAVQRLSTAAPREVDLGVLRLTRSGESARAWAFVNVASFGIGGLTDKIVNSSPKWLGGKATFFVGALRAMAVYRNAPITLRVDGRTVYEGPIFNVALANGKYFGGGMLIAPEADSGDGLFDVVVMGDLSRAESIGLSRKIYAGTHLAAAKVLHTRGAVVEAHPLGGSTDVLIDMDGETPGALPLVASVARRALRFRI
jgi:YegS/Rv2252/BmrU family lipid kinase